MFIIALLMFPRTRAIATGLTGFVIAYKLGGSQITNLFSFPSSVMFYHSPSVAEVAGWSSLLADESPLECGN